MYYMRVAVTGKTGSMEIFDNIHAKMKDIEAYDDFYDFVSIVNVDLGKYNMATIWWKASEMSEDDDD